MKTVTIQIGNSDDKLSQKEWASFVECVYKLLGEKTVIHFAGTSYNAAPWQNACWVISIQEKYFPSLKNDLSEIGKQFHQDSIAWTVGETEFI